MSLMMRVRIIARLYLLIIWLMAFGGVVCSLPPSWNGKKGVFIIFLKIKYLLRDRWKKYIRFVLKGIIHVWVVICNQVNYYWNPNGMPPLPPSWCHVQEINYCKKEWKAFSVLCDRLSIVKKRCVISRLDWVGV